MASREAHSNRRIRLRVRPPTTVQFRTNQTQIQQQLINNPISQPIRQENANQIPQNVANDLPANEQSSSSETEIYSLTDDSESQTDDADNELAQQIAALRESVATQRAPTHATRTNSQGASQEQSDNQIQNEIPLNASQASRSLSLPWPVDAMPSPIPASASRDLFVQQIESTHHANSNASQTIHEQNLQPDSAEEQTAAAGPSIAHFEVHLQLQPNAAGNSTLHNDHAPSSSHTNGDEDFQPTPNLHCRSDNGKRKSRDDDPIDNASPHRRQKPFSADDFVTECPICIEGCTNSGPHRIVTFKCGHLFGKSCILEWIQRGNSSTNRRLKSTTTRPCPTCKKPICKRDMIPLFSRTIVPIDTLERDTALTEAANARNCLATIQKQNRDLETKLTQMKLMRDVYQRESVENQKMAVKLRYEIESMKLQLSNLQNKCKEAESVAAELQESSSVSLNVVESDQTSSSQSVLPIVLPSKQPNIVTATSTSVLQDQQQKIHDGVMHLHGEFRHLTVIRLPAVRDTARTLCVSKPNNTLFVTMQQEDQPRNGFFDAHYRYNAKNAGSSSGGPSSSIAGRHGVMKIHLLDTSRRMFIPIHDRTIRDCCVQSSIPSNHSSKLRTNSTTSNTLDSVYSITKPNTMALPEDDVILTTSLDRTLKLTSTRSGTVLRSFSMDCAGWSCCFDTRVPTTVYVGTCANEVLVFDTRQSGGNGVGHDGGQGSMVSVPMHRVKLPAHGGKGVHSLRVCDIKYVGMQHALHEDDGNADRDQNMYTAIVGASMGDVFAISVALTENNDLNDTNGQSDQAEDAAVAGSSTDLGDAQIHRSASRSSSRPVWRSVSEPVLYPLSLRQEPAMPSAGISGPVDTATSFVVHEESGSWAVALRRPGTGMVYRSGRIQPPQITTTSNHPVFDPPPSSQHPIDTNIIAYGPMQRSMTRIHLINIPTTQNRQDEINTVTTIPVLVTPDETTSSILLYRLDMPSRSMPTQPSCPWKTLHMGSTMHAQNSVNSGHVDRIAVMDVVWVPADASVGRSYSYLVALGSNLELHFWEFVT